MLNALKIGYGWKNDSTAKINAKQHQDEFKLENNVIQCWKFRTRNDEREREEEGARVRGREKKNEMKQPVRLCVYRVNKFCI